jgi:hypothetical protein
VTPPTTWLSPLALLAAICAQAPVTAAQDDSLSDAPKFAVSTLPIAAEDVIHALRDMDGDGDLDLLRIDTDGVALRRMGDNGEYAAADEGQLPWPSPDVGWHLTDMDGDGATELLLLLSGKTLVQYRVAAEGSFDESTTLLEQPAGHLPRGVRRVPFLREVNGDDRLDAVLPGLGQYLIHLGKQPGPNSDGVFEDEAIVVAFEAEIEYSLGERGRVDGRFGEAITVPWFSLRDIDLDGTPDLISETSDQVLFHLAQPSLSTQPTWRLDLAALRDELGEAVLDMDDLLRSVGQRVSWRLDDLDNTAPLDLIIQQAGSFMVYLGGANGQIDRAPDLLLKSSGSVLHYTVRNVLGDPLPELQIIRGDVVSLGDVMRLLAVPGALNFDVFTYENTAGNFARKPTKRTRITLEIPRLFAFIERLEAMQSSLQERMHIPARRIDLDGDGLRDDVADWVDGQLLLYRNIVPKEFDRSLVEQLTDTSLDGLVESYILSDLDQLTDGEVNTIDLEDITKLRLTHGWELRQLSADLKPLVALRTPFSGELEDLSITVHDLNGDGVGDVLITGDVADGHKALQVVVLRPEAQDHSDG